MTDRRTEREKLELRLEAVKILNEKGTEKTNRSLRAVAASILREE